MSRSFQSLATALFLCATTLLSHAADVTLVPRGAVWKYLDNNSDQGTAWKEATFSDSTWAAGPAPLGFGDTHIVTTVASGPTNGRYITTYFRKSFSVADPSTITALAINLLRDDGAVIYLNGTEIARDNLPAGAINYQTIAPVIVSNADETTYFPLTPTSSPLVAGTNVLAVEIHQRDNTSSDLGFDMDLIATVPGNNVPPSVTLTSPDGSASFDAPASLELEATAFDTDGAVTKVEFYNGATKLGEATAAPYTLAWNNVYTGSYTLTAKASDNAGGVTISPPVTLVVDNLDNVLPSVSLTAPLNNAAISGSQVDFTATASDSDGFVAKVEFYQGATKVGEDLTSPYAFSWTGVAPGTYTLTAKATDNDGSVSTSNTVNITVAAAVNFSYTQNFNGLGTAGTALNTLLPGWSHIGTLGGSNTSWATSIPVSGAQSAATVGTTNNTLIANSAAASGGISSNTQAYNLALAASTADRCLGTSPTSGAGNILQLSLTNSTSSSITAITMAYDTRRFTAVATANELPGYWLFYSLNNGNTWTNVSSLNPTITNVPNTVGVTSTPATTITFTAPWTAGGMILFRWIDDNANQTSPDQLQGLDNVSIVAAAFGGAPPTVSLTAPANGATYTAPATVNLSATAADSDGTVSKVEFYNGATKIGEATSAPYNFAWTGVAAGTYSLTARAIDNNNNITTSSAVSVTVNVLVIGNPPTVSLTSPASGATYTSPATVNLAANAADSDGTISKVEFYNGTTKLGEATASPFAYTWVSVAAGTYSLTAKAIDNDNNVTTSTAVSITVNAPATLTRSPYLNMPNHNSIVVRWKTSLANVGRVYYGTSPTNLSQFTDESVSRTDHDVRLTGLSSYTRYYYSVGYGTTALTPEPVDTTSVRTTAFTNYPNPTASDYTFRTSPLPGTAVASRIWVVGDCGRGSTSQAGGRDAYYNYLGANVPDLCLQMGDNAYNSGTETEYQTGYFNMYPTIFRKMPQWSTLGNHDANGGDTSATSNWPYFDMFTFPKNAECGGVASGTEHYYSFDYANIHFICLDSQTTLANSSASAPQTVWLKADLAANTQTWTVVFFHHPPYTKGSHDSDTEGQLITMRTVYNPILEAGGVDIVFNGHSHNYERSYLLNGHYGNASTITSAMRLNGGNGSTSGFTVSTSTGNIRRAPAFSAVANVSGTVVPPDGAYIKPLTGPRDNFGLVYNTNGSAGQADGGTLNHNAMYVSYNTVGTVDLQVNGNTLTATYVQSGGTTPDNFTIVKQGAADHDGDGLSDEYEIANGLNRFSAADAALDSDGDGLTNLQNFQTGTSAQTSTASPKIQTVVPQTDGSVVLQLSTVVGKSYKVEANNAFPTGVWSVVATNIAGTGGLVAVPDSAAAGAPNRIYRVTVLP